MKILVLSLVGSYLISNFSFAHGSCEYAFEQMLAPKTYSKDEEFSSPPPTDHEIHLANFESSQGYKDPVQFSFELMGLDPNRELYSCKSNTGKRYCLQKGKDHWQIRGDLEMDLDIKSQYKELTRLQHHETYYIASSSLFSFMGSGTGGIGSTDYYLNFNNSRNDFDLAIFVSKAFERARWQYASCELVPMSVLNERVRVLATQLIEHQRRR